MPRKTRSDKGTVKLMARDIEAVKWICEMGEVSTPQLQVLLARYAETHSQPTVSESRVLQMVRRWVTLGWVEYRNLYRDPKKPGSVYATRKALKDLGYEYGYRVLELTSLTHTFAVSFVRLWLEARYASIPDPAG